MPKNQHGKDKMYLTASEWKELGGKKKRKTIGYKRLPFNCCALTLQPFTTPVASPSGYTYDFVNILPYVKKHGKDPVTGESISIKDLIHLNFAKNSLGKFHDPLSYREFSDNTHMVAIKTTGNVYSYETVKRLNISQNNWKDLLSQTPFTKKDILVLQDPAKQKLREFENFAHVKNKVKKSKVEASIRTNSMADKVLSKAKLMEKEKRKEKKGKEGKDAEKGKSAKVQSRFTTGEMAASFTSTAITPKTVNEMATANIDEVNEKHWRELRAMKKKGYVRLQTSLGDLNLELHFDICPAASENFITLAQKGYYNGTKFHRLIPGFMIQGGDPTGTGRGGESIWGKPFRDEIQTKYTHSERGVLSMANSGKNTNRSQFYITFAPCPHLDKKHTVFGKLVGGYETLNRMEATAKDEKDRPLEDLTIIRALVFVNPVDDLKQSKKSEVEKKEAEEEEKKRLERLEAQKKERERQREIARKASNGRVGRYLNIPKPTSTTMKETVPVQQKKKKAAAWSFNSW